MTHTVWLILCDSFRLFESPFKQEFDVEKGIYYDAHMEQPIPDSGHGLFSKPISYLWLLSWSSQLFSKLDWTIRAIISENDPIYMGIELKGVFRPDYIISVYKLWITPTNNPHDPNRNLRCYIISIDVKS